MLGRERLHSKSVSFDRLAGPEFAHGRLERETIPSEVAERAERLSRAAWRPYPERRLAPLQAHRAEQAR